MSDRLKQIRNRIDALDDRILRLLNERARLAQDTGRAKRGAKYRPEREAQVLRRLGEMNTGPLSADMLRRLYTEIMSACRSLEDGIKFAYLGPPGTYSQEAAIKQFESESFRDLVDRALGKAAARSRELAAGK